VNKVVQPKKKDDKNDKGAFVFFGLAGLAAFFLLGKKSITPSGTISVTSTPTGVTAFIGTFSAVTPFTKKLAPGTYAINISADGYQNWADTFTIVANETVNIAVVLIPVTPGDVVYDAGINV